MRQRLALGYRHAVTRAAKSKVSHGKDVLNELLKAAVRKSDLDRDKELLVRAANEIARLRALALTVIKEPRD